MSYEFAVDCAERLAGIPGSRSVLLILGDYFDKLVKTDKKTSPPSVQYSCSPGYIVERLDDQLRK